MVITYASEVLVYQEFKEDYEQRTKMPMNGKLAKEIL